ncbi:MAG: hypothetical protein HPY53_08580 [Brevinematales bacterium]|nr:hypothetical protein [Brevinematales bacterium]
MKKILGQILSSSLEDTQGEIFTKQDLIDLAEAANKKAPIDFNQRHDPKLGKLGYINNFKVVPSRIHLNEYDLIGDIYLSIDEIPPDLKAFSLSTIKPIYGNSDAKIAFFIPYPFYQNEEYLKSLFIDNEIIIGKHIQKAAEVPLVALIISKIVSTIVDKVFENTVYPVLKRNFSIIIELWKKSIETNLIIWQQTNNFQYQIMGSFAN